jgi:hypothetical protein
VTAYQKKRGRPPSIWRSEIGAAFAYAVFQARSKIRPRLELIKTTDAIRKVLRQPEFAHLKKRYPNLRYLEKKYQEASDYWNPFARLSKEHRKAFHKALREQRRWWQERKKN